jgi:hypothetical protein
VSRTRDKRFRKPLVHVGKPLGRDVLESLGDLDVFLLCQLPEREPDYASIIEPQLAPEGLQKLQVLSCGRYCYGRLFLLFLSRHCGSNIRIN